MLKHNLRFSLVLATLLLWTPLARAESEVLGHFEISGEKLGGSPFHGKLEILPGGRFIETRKDDSAFGQSIQGQLRWQDGDLILSDSRGIVGALTNQTTTTRRFKRVGELWRWQNGSVQQSLSAFVAKDTASKKVLEARTLAASKIGSARDPEERNKRITAAYAKLYLESPELFQWAGLASYASEFTGEWLQRTKWLSRLPISYSLLSYLGVPSPIVVREALEIGNRAVYEELYWQHLAYQQGGIDSLQAGAKLGLVSPEMLLAWTELDSGRQELDKGHLDLGRGHIDRARKAFLSYEQGRLQSLVYEPFEAPFKRASRSPFWRNLFPIPSPIPGAGSNFHHFIGEDADLTRLDHRLDWINGSLGPAMLELSRTKPKLLKEDMEEMIAKDKSRAWESLP